MDTRYLILTGPVIRENMMHRNNILVQLDLKTMKWMFKDKE